MAAHEPTPGAGQAPSLDPASGRAPELEARVLARAAQDPAFRARLLADPKAAFAELGLRIPPEVQVQALEETADHYYLVLPAAAPAPGAAGAALSDAQLEAVAGGAFGDYTSDSMWTGCGSGQSGCVATEGTCGETTLPRSHGGSCSG